MIVNFLVRQGWSVEKALRIFAEHRPPGIYKEDYIRELYRYNHEPLCAPASFLHPTASISALDHLGFLGYH